MLKPCPFCGSSKLKIELPCAETPFILCMNCDTYGPTAESDEEAINRWNTRADSYSPSDPKADYEAEK